MTKEQADELVQMAKEAKDGEGLVVLIEVILNCLADLDDRLKALEDKVSGQ